ncbi:MAG: L-threonylcarbamoyladenylate synthase [Myxococcota bacterium]
MSDLGLDAAVAWVRDGRVLAYPTETLWGLGGRAQDAQAVERLQRAKGRAGDAPISILVPAPGSLASLGFDLDPTAEAVAARFWPGPLTLVLPCRGRFGPGIARADGAVGVRCSPHPEAMALARACEDAGLGPLTATSCNRSGEPAAERREDARRFAETDSEVAVLDGAPDAPPTGTPRPASTVLDLTAPRARVLRWGAIPETELSPLLEELAAA